MVNKIQLKHPTGKKAIRMDQLKYDLLKKALLNYLKNAGESTHKEILSAIEQDFRKNETNFEGSLEWHMEWVKLDLEARKEINRMAGSSPIKFGHV